MPVTPRGIWTPADSDDWDLTVDLAAMALSIDTALGTTETNSVANSWYGVGTIAERDALLPPVRKTNYIWRDSATGLTFRYTGSAWANTNDTTNIARSANTSGNQAVAATPVDITGMSVTFTLPSASIIRFNIQVATYGGDTGHVVNLTVTNGTLSQNATRAANSSPTSANTGNVHTWTPEFAAVPAGTHTFKVQATRAAGSSGSNVTIAPSSGNQSIISVDRIG